jgi:hypothetical protein
MKNNLDYYPHKVQSHNHLKFKALRMLYRRTFNVDGWAGEGKFWALNNLIAESRYCVLDISNELKKLQVAVELDFTLEELDVFLDLLVNKCDLVEFREGGYLVTDDVQNVLAELQEDRQQARERQKNRRENLSRVTNEMSRVTKQMSQNGKSGTVQSEAFRTGTDQGKQGVDADKGKKGESKSTHESSVTSEMSRVTNDPSRRINELSPRDQHTKKSKVYKDNTNVLSTDRKLSVDEEQIDEGGYDDPENSQTARGGAPRRAGKQEKQLSIIQLCRDPFRTIYLTWYETTEPVPFVWMYKMHENHLKKIIQYFVAHAEVEFRGMEPSNDQIFERAKSLFTTMLNNWGKLTTQYLQQKDIKNIAKELANINQQINSYGTHKPATSKNYSGSSGKNNKSAGAEKLADRLAEELGGDFTIR